MNNKKLLSMVLSAAMAATSIFPATVYAAVSGDINGDGVLTSADLDILQGYILGKHDLTEEQAKLADLNADQSVDIYDVTALRKKILSTDRTLTFKSVTDRMNDGITDALKKLDLQSGGTVVKSTAELKTALSPYFSETVVNSYLKKYNDTFFKDSVLLVKPAYFDPAKFSKNGTLTKLSCGCDNTYAGLYTTGPTVDQGLNIRKEHDFNSASLGVIPPGAKFNITYAHGTANGDFGHVTYNNISGYVNMAYVTKLSSTAPTYVAVPDLKVDSVKYSKGTVTVAATEYNASSNVSFAAAVLAQAVVPKKDYYASTAQWTVTTTSTTTTTTTTTTCAYPLAKTRMEQKNIKTLKDAFYDCSAKNVTAVYVEWEKDASKLTLQKAADYGFNSRNGNANAVAKGNCYVLAAMFCEMARLLGYDAHLISGQVPLLAGGYGPHGWVEIIENGTTYVYDPDYTLETGGNGFALTYGHTVWPLEKISEIK